MRGLRVGTPRRLTLPIQTGLMAGAVLLAAAALFAVLLSAVHDQQTTARRAIEADDGSLVALERLEALTAETQSGTRGFVLTREPRLLEHWRDARDQIRPASAQLLRRAGSEPLQLPQARTLTILIRSLVVDWQQPLIRLARRDPAAAAARIATGEGDRRTAGITQLIAALRSDGLRLRARRDREARSATDRATVSAVFGMSCAFVILAAAALFMVLRVGRPLARVADEARLARDELDAVLDASPTAIVARERDGTVTTFNAAAERLVGSPAEEVIGRQSPHLGDPDRADVLRFHYEALTGKVVRNVQRRVTVGDGTRTVLVSVAPLRDRSGEVVGSVTVAEDISDRERALHDAAIAEAHWRAAVRNLPGAALLIVDEHLRYVDADGAALSALGVEPEELVGRGIGDRVPMTDAVRDLLSEAFRTALDGRPNEYELEVRGLTFRGRAVPLELAGGRRGAMALAVDVSDMRRGEAELRRFAAELERSNRELEEFAYIASHDLQEPLRKIQAFGDRLEAACGADLDPRAADYLARMRGAAARMSELITGLLTYSRITARSHPSGAVDLEAVIRDVVSDLQPAIEEAQATVVAGALPEVEGDAAELRQLFQNLIANAVKFRRADVAPRVEITELERDATQVTLQVADNGIGFEGQYAERVFRMFERLQGRTQFEGSGMGLAVCRRIVERHGGAITAHGEPGRGARFEVTLPLHREAAAEPRDEDRRGALA